ncbi:CbtB domain-containing protein [Poseidonocella sedimentorum]|uniref:Cobalt transporter subunit CbtB n=1 Tax=Poseidonocella sedimentorum TaxID=871652 RepID=A0A1I6EJU9_9RHOB|nr:CbtB domain-containing protein [Poseidonocella sedimentorum]SFR17975.1 cobalt transporter subunit CbtB [Poseidonocella sedimentorum]
MTVATAVRSETSSAREGLAAIFMVAAIGIGIVALTGHVQASALHDAAHDVRHATGFPCH